MKTRRWLFGAALALVACVVWIGAAFAQGANGANGTVKSVSVTQSAFSTTYSATVHYDDPPPNGRTETYVEIQRAQYDLFLSAMSGNLLVDVNYTSGSNGTVSAHKP